MKRFLFFLEAYKGFRKFQLLMIFFFEKISIIEFTRALFSKDLVESRSLLGHIYDNGGTAHSTSEGMLVRYYIGAVLIRIRLRWNSSDFLAFNQVFIKEEYKRLSSLGNPNPIIVDAGANVGCATLYFHAFYPGSFIIAIEPDEENFNALMHNLRLNELINVHAVRVALWHMNGQVALIDNYRDKRQWSIQVSDQGEKKVESKTLQEILNDAGINAMNILKMDIEGAEVPIFSLDDSIEKALVSVEMVGIEVHEKNSIVEKKLKLMGFSCVTEGETLFAEK